MNTSTYGMSKIRARSIMSDSRRPRAGVSLERVLRLELQPQPRAPFGALPRRPGEPVEVDPPIAGQVRGDAPHSSDERALDLCLILALAEPRNLPPLQADQGREAVPGQPDGARAALSVQLVTQDLGERPRPIPGAEVSPPGPRCRRMTRRGAAGRYTRLQSRKTRAPRATSRSGKIDLADPAPPCTRTGSPWPPRSRRRASP